MPVGRSRILLGVALLLSACAALPASPPSPESPTRTIAIASAIGPEIILGETGAAASDDASQHIAVPGWDLDGIAITAARTALARRFKVVAAASTPQDGPALSSTAAILAAARKGALTPTPADLILVISSSNSAQNRQGHPTVDYGVGVSRWRGTPPFSRPPYVHAFLAVTVIDGKRFTLVTQASLKMKARRQSVLGDEETLPFVPLEEFDWRDHWSDLTERQHEQIRQLVATLLKQAIPFTIEKLTLPES
jgi:hypothetical protein